MNISNKEKVELTKVAIRTWLKSAYKDDKRCCVKFVNDVEFDRLVEEVKLENDGLFTMGEASGL